MHSLEVRARVRGSAAAETYATLCDFESYKNYSAAVRSVKITMLDDGQMLSSWETNFRDGIMRWVERDVFNPAEGTIYFEQTEGDIESFSGRWSVRPSGEDCLVSFAATFDIGIPSLSKVLEPVAEQALRENVIAVLRGFFGARVEILSDDTPPGDGPRTHPA